MNRYSMINQHMILPWLFGVFALASCSDSSDEYDALNAESDFSAIEQVSIDTLVIKVSVTANGIEVLESRLIRAPQKANSAMADLHVSASVKGTESYSYVMPDPRLRKREQSELQVAQSADSLIFVPLSVDFDEITIRPVAGREPVVSAGGVFDPRPWAISACAAETTHYSLCPDLLALAPQLGVVINP